MKKISFVACLVIFLVLDANASIQLTTCTSGIINVSIIMDSGKWIGVSTRDSSGKIYDLPPIKKSFGPSNDNFKSNSDTYEYRVSTWKSYDGNLMHGRISDTGWQKCH
jgi:hypothetical protein